MKNIRVFKRLLIAFVLTGGLGQRIFSSEYTVSPSPEFAEHHFKRYKCYRYFSGTDAVSSRVKIVEALEIFLALAQRYRLVRDPDTVRKMYPWWLSIDKDLSQENVEHARNLNRKKNINIGEFCQWYKRLSPEFQDFFNDFQEKKNK